MYKPVDRLGDIREQLETLKIEAEEIRQQLLAGRIDVNGDRFDAEIFENVNQRIVLSDAKALLSPEDYASLVSSKPFKCIRIVKKSINISDVPSPRNIRDALKQLRPTGD